MAVARGLGRRALLAGVGGALLTGCARRHLETDVPNLTTGGADGYQGPPVRLRFWNGLTGSDGTVMRALCREFSRTNPNIEVEMFAIPWDSFYQKFPAAVVSGLAPDVGLMQSFHVATNAARNVIIPVDELATELGLSEDTISAVVWDSGMVAGRRYAIPLDVWPDCLFYNRTVLAKAGLDPDDPPRDNASYLNALRTLAEHDIAGHWLPAVDAQGVGRGFDSLLWQLGGELYTPDGTRALFDSAAGVEALQWQVNLIRRGWSPTNVNGSDASVAFKNDRNAFMWGGPGALINDLSGVESLDWGAVPLPRIGDQRAGFAGSHQLVVMRQREFDQNKLRATASFIGWLSDNSVRWAEAGPLPVRRDVLESAEFAALEIQNGIEEGVSAARFYPRVPGIFEVQSTILYPAISDVLLQLDTPRNALKRAVRQAEHLLNQNRQKYAEMSG